MKNIVVLSGAGLSKESGIPTFRDSKDGLWHNHKIEDVASPEGWARDKNVVLEFYKQRTENILNCQPNDAHKAFAKLDEKYNVLHVTQNIDDLLERAGCKNVRHIHGDVLHRKCEWHYSASMLDGDTKYCCNYLISQTEAVKAGEVCPKCGGNLRPHVVWFGEPVDMSGIDELPENTDVFIVVGTSVEVHPAAGLLWKFKNCSQRYYIDPVPAPRLQSYTRLEGIAGKMVPELVEKLLCE